MSWQVHVPGANPEKDRITARRFGPGFEKPCRMPGMIECAKWECQAQNECCYVLTEDDKYNAALDRQRRKRR